MANPQTISQHIQAPLEYVYYAVSTKAGWLEWFGLKGIGFVAPETILLIHTTDPHNFIFHFKSFEQNRAVRFTLIELENYHTAEIAIELSGTDQDVTLALTTESEDAALAENLAAIWEKYLPLMKSTIETGKDMVLWNRPFLGVTIEHWITPELAQEKGLPVEYGMLLNSVVEGGGADLAGVGHTDIIAVVDEIKIHSYHDLQTIFSRHQVGDVIPITYYHNNEPKQSSLILGQYPIPKIPANAQDLADDIQDFFDKLNSKIASLMEGKTEAQLDFCPDGNEWSAKQILAHMIADFTDSMAWLSSYIGGQPVHVYTSVQPARLQAIQTVNPTMAGLLDAFKRNQEELLAYVNALPAEVSGRKSSLAMLSFRLHSSFHYHYINHLHQLSNTLIQAADIRGN